MVDSWFIHSRCGLSLGVTSSSGSNPQKGRAARVRAQDRDWWDSSVYSRLERLVLDSTLNAAARALAAGDPLGALRRVSLREDAHGLALRGVAMAQLGELRRARELLRSAAEQLVGAENLAHARCVVAAAEVSLAMRELAKPEPGLEAAIATLRAGGDLANACHGQVVCARRHLLCGEPEAASASLAGLELRGASAMLVGLVELMRADIDIRCMRAGSAGEALERARSAAERSGIAALQAEVAAAQARLTVPAVRTIQAGHSRLLTWREAEQHLGAECLVVNACRRSLDFGGETRDFARRPILFTLLRVLAEACPADCSREHLIGRVFEAPRANDSLRARLRVEVSRLRGLTKGLAEISASAEGFILKPLQGRSLLVLAPPDDSDTAALTALLGDGAAWSTSALAVALGTSQRSVQRALAELEASGGLRSLGRGPSQRWVATATGSYATALLLPARVATG